MMAWYHELQFVSAVAMPDELAEAYGTTVNGMWSAPEMRTDDSIKKLQAAGGRVLFSVPLIALTPKIYHQPEYQYLIDEACRDIEGKPSLVPWYYWETEPVYSICFYSAPFRKYLFERCKHGIERGMDVVNLDEINTSLGLMNREPGGSGFCTACLNRFRKHLQQVDGLKYPLQAELLKLNDEALRRRLKQDDELYQQYRQFHAQEAYQVAVDFIQELRAYDRSRNPQFAITANLAYLGNIVPEQGDLWGPMWGEQIDLVMMENIYEPKRGAGHLLLPRGKFTAWYRLASAFSSHAPAWICPSIMVPKQLAGEKRIEYYLLMFVESYANNGRFGYYWWPGVDMETRLKATAPEQLKDYIRFFKRHHAYLDQPSTNNSIAILYLNSSMRIRPEAHFKYVALAQALAESGYQYDVIYGTDEIYGSGDLDLEKLRHYQVILIPEAGHLSTSQGTKLAQLSDDPGCEVIIFSHDQEAVGRISASALDDSVLFNFWLNYLDEDRNKISACLKRYAHAQIRTSHPLVNVIKHTKDEHQILHILNYDYDGAKDHVIPVENLKVNLAWEASNSPNILWLNLAGQQQLTGKLEGGRLAFEIPHLDIYSLVIIN